jgi:hypothetical protein
VSLPYQIADRIEFETIQCEGADKAVPIAQGNEPLANTLDVLIRSDPSNASDSTDRTTWIYIGNATRQTFPLRANESVNLRVVRRSDIYFRGPTGHLLHVISAKLNNANC